MAAWASLFDFFPDERKPNTHPQFAVQNASLPIQVTPNPLPLCTLIHLPPHTSPPTHPPSTSTDPHPPSTYPHPLPTPLPTPLCVHTHPVSLLLSLAPLTTSSLHFFGAHASIHIFPPQERYRFIRILGLGAQPPHNPCVPTIFCVFSRYQYPILKL